MICAGNEAPPITNQITKVTIVQYLRRYEVPKHLSTKSAQQPSRITSHLNIHFIHITMSKTVQIGSSSQFHKLLETSKIVVTDCMHTFPRAQSACPYEPGNASDFEG